MDIRFVVQNALRGESASDGPSQLAMARLVRRADETRDFLAVRDAGEDFVRVCCCEACAAAVHYINNTWIADADAANAVSHDWPMFLVKLDELVPQLTIILIPGSPDVRGPPVAVRERGRIASSLSTV